MPNNCTNPNTRISICARWSVPSICIFNPDVIEKSEPFINNHKFISEDEIGKMLDEGKSEEEIINLILNSSDRELYYENVLYTGNEFKNEVLGCIGQVCSKRKRAELNKEKARVIAKNMLRYGSEKNKIIAEIFKVLGGSDFCREEIKFSLDVIDILSNESTRKRFDDELEAFKIMEKNGTLYRLEEGNSLVHEKGDFYIKERIKELTDSGNTKKDILKKSMRPDKFQGDLIDWAFECLEEQERELKSEIVLQKMEQALEWEIQKIEERENKYFKGVYIDEFNEALEQTIQDMKKGDERSKNANSPLVIAKMKQAIGKEVGKTKEEEAEFSEVISKSESKGEDYI